MSGDMTMATIVFYLVLGLIAGTFSATFGIGSGIMLIPVITLFAAIPQKDAQGIALAVMVPMALMGALRYHWNPEIHIDFRIVAILTVSVIIGANLGASIAGYLSNQKLQLGFGILLLVVASRFIFLGIHGSQH